jgi:hypothetical protein
MPTLLLKRTVLFAVFFCSALLGAQAQTDSSVLLGSAIQQLGTTPLFTQNQETNALRFRVGKDTNPGFLRVVDPHAGKNPRPTTSGASINYQALGSGHMTLGVIFSSGKSPMDPGSILIVQSTSTSTALMLYQLPRLYAPFAEWELIEQARSPLGNPAKPPYTVCFSLIPQPGGGQKLSGQLLTTGGDVLLQVAGRPATPPEDIKTIYLRCYASTPDEGFELSKLVLTAR